MPSTPAIGQSDDLLQSLLPFTLTPALRPALKTQEAPLISQWCDMDASTLDAYLTLPEDLPELSLFSPISLAASSPPPQQPALSEIAQIGLPPTTSSPQLCSPIERSKWEQNWNPSVGAATTDATLSSFYFSDLIGLATEPFSELSSEAEADSLSPSFKPQSPAKRLRRSQSYLPIAAAARAPKPARTPTSFLAPVLATAFATIGVPTAVPAAGKRRVLTEEEKLADRRRRNREASSRSYYRRKQRRKDAAAADLRSRKHVTTLPADEREFRPEV